MAMLNRIPIVLPPFQGTYPQEGPTTAAGSTSVPDEHDAADDSMMTSYMDFLCSDVHLDQIRTTPNIRVNIASTGRQLGTPYGDSGHEGPSTSHREEGLTIVTPSMVDTTIRIGYPHNFDQSQFERTSTSFEELASTAFGVDTAQDTARGDTATGSDEHMHETGGSGPRPGDKRDTAIGSDEHMVDLDHVLGTREILLQDLMSIWVLRSLSGDFGCLSSLTAIRASECSRLEENTMDKLGKMKGLMIVDIDESPMLKKRWKQVKGQYSLAVVECGKKIIVAKRYPYADVMCRAFFHSDSKFLHVDENGQLVESACPAGGIKLWFLLKECDVNVKYSASSSSNSRCWEAVKKKWMELVASEGGQMIYVDMGGSWEERERRVQQALPHLPSNTHAWIAPDNRASLFFAYSVQRYYIIKHFRGGRRAKLGVENCIVSATTSVDEEGRRRLDDLKFILPDLIPFVKTDYEHISDQLLSPVTDSRKQGSFSMLNILLLYQYSVSGFLSIH
ncbi:hypothetical protein SUGI_0963740 [Cryptomeria japonica]|nr:hypothetical protein SUGI_0963740 [Cryptomeria japonica]